jgi:hypothetical protein
MAKRKAQMKKRTQAEQLGRQAALNEIVAMHKLVYRARGCIGPSPLPSLSSPGLFGWELCFGRTLPVVVGR